MKKFLDFVIEFVFPLYLVGYEFGFNDYLKGKFPEYEPVFKWVTIILVIIATAAHYVVTHRNPEKKIEKLQLASNKCIKVLAEAIIKDLSELEIHVKLNVMLLKKKLNPNFVADFFSGKGFGKSLYVEFYECDWTAPEDFPMPDNFMLGKEQGVNGLAVKKKGLVMYGIKGKSKSTIQSELNLNDAQYDNLKEITFLASSPIYIQIEGKKISTLVGILTLQTETLEIEKLDYGYDLKQDPDAEFWEPIKDYMETYMNQLSKVYGLLNF